MALNDVFDMLNMALGGEADPKGIRGNRPAMEAIALEKALEHCRTIETTTAAEFKPVVTNIYIVSAVGGARPPGIHHEGSLLKKKGMLTSWKPRWFSISTKRNSTEEIRAGAKSTKLGSFTYYERTEETTKGGVKVNVDIMKGDYPLTQFIDAGALGAGNTGMFSVRFDARTYELKADTDAECQQWLSAFKDVHKWQAAAAPRCGVAASAGADLSDAEIAAHNAAIAATKERAKAYQLEHPNYFKEQESTVIPFMKEEKEGWTWDGLHVHSSSFSAGNSYSWHHGWDFDGSSLFPHGKARAKGFQWDGEYLYKWGEDKETGWKYDEETKNLYNVVEGPDSGWYIDNRQRNVRIVLTFKENQSILGFVLKGDIPVPVWALCCGFIKGLYMDRFN